MTKQAQNAIKGLENFQPLHWHDKASILLVVGGLKPAAMFYFEEESFESPSPAVHVNHLLIQKIETILASLGLSFERWIWTTDDPESIDGFMSREIVHYFISNDVQKSQQLKQLVADDWMGNTFEIGILLGYPLTAVRAYSENDGELYPPESLPKSAPDVSENNMRLLGFRLSKKHWQDEIKILEEYGNYLEETSHLIYREATRSSS